MKTNHDGTVTLNAYDTWTSCVACGQRVTSDSIHTCSPQLKQLTYEDRSMLIRTLKWAEDLLRVAGHDEAVSDVQDCLMILRKAQYK